MRLEVRPDNVTALSMVATMRGRGWAVNTIARELALDFALAAFRPAVCAHVAGVGLSMADARSRRCAPGFDFKQPPELPLELEAVPEPRPRGWFRSLGPPGGDND